MDEREEPLFYGREDFEGQGWIEWTYLFDEEARSLRVWAGNPAFDDAWAKPDWTLHIGPDGRADPPLFEHPEPGWHQMPVVPGWEADSKQAPIVEAAAFARRPGDWELLPDGLFLFRTVVPDEDASDSGRHLAFSRARELDPECQLRDSIGTSEPIPPLQWLVPEWLRIRQVPPA